MWLGNFSLKLICINAKFTLKGGLTWIKSHQWSNGDEIMWSKYLEGTCLNKHFSAWRVWLSWTGTIGSRLSECWLSEFSIIQTLGCRHVFSSRRKKTLVTGVLLQEIAKLLYKQLSPDATTPFSASTGVRSRFTTSELAERSRERCSTLYYSVAN